MIIDCPHETVTWRLTIPNEDGWWCLDCSAKLGYRPDLDDRYLDDKVSAILHDLYSEDVLYVSNGTEGDMLTAMVVRELRQSKAYDQQSIAAALLQMNDLERHADFWKREADKWMQKARDAGDVPPVPAAEVMRQAGVPGLFEQT